MGLASQHNILSGVSVPTHSAERGGGGITSMYDDCFDAKRRSSLTPATEPLPASATCSTLESPPLISVSELESIVIGMQSQIANMGHTLGAVLSKVQALQRENAALRDMVPTSSQALHANAPLNQGSADLGTHQPGVIRQGNSDP